MANQRELSSKRVGVSHVVATPLTWNWGKVYDTLEGIEEIVLAHPLKTRLIADAQIKADKIDAAALAIRRLPDEAIWWPARMCLARPRGCVRTSCVSGFTGRGCATNAQSAARLA